MGRIMIFFQKNVILTLILHNK